MRGAAFLIVLSIVVCILVKIHAVDYEIDEEDLDIRTNYHRLNTNSSHSISPLNTQMRDIRLKANFVKDLIEIEQRAKELEEQFESLDSNPGRVKPWFWEAIGKGVRFLCPHGDLVGYFVLHRFSNLRSQFPLMQSQYEKIVEDKANELLNDEDGYPHLTCSIGARQSWKCGPQSNKLYMYAAWKYSTSVDTCRVCPVQNCCSQHDDCWDAVKNEEVGRTYKKCDDKFADCVSNGYSEDRACQEWMMKFPELVKQFADHYHG
ncbi:Phospholipase A2 domain-containing protein [Aphelenchoides besseyi]|nr:Phospholipase A2 domain-containing protein [Aphelenchoides besseyi]